MNIVYVNYKHRIDFWHWCFDLGCEPEYRDTMVINSIAHDVWHVPIDDIYTISLIKWT